MEEEIEGYRDLYRLPPFSGWNSYLSDLAEGSQPGWFGLKTMYEPFEKLCEALPEARSGLVDSVWIHMSRRDLVAQAVSLTKALQTKAWTCEKAPERDVLEYSNDAMIANLNWIRSDASRWETFFEKEGIRPFRVVYEDYVAGQAEAIKGVLGAMGITGEGARLLAKRAYSCRRLRKQGDDLNREWGQRFRAHLDERGLKHLLE